MFDYDLTAKYAEPSNKAYYKIKELLKQIPRIVASVRDIRDFLVMFHTYMAIYCFCCNTIYFFISPPLNNI